MKFYALSETAIVCGTKVYLQAVTNPYDPACIGVFVLHKSGLIATEVAQYLHLLYFHFIELPGKSMHMPAIMHSI